MALNLRLKLREIRVQDGLPEEHHYAGNRVTTGEQTMSAWIIAILEHQAARLGSWWFLIVAVAAMNPLHYDYEASPLPLILLGVYFTLVLARDAVALYNRKAVDREFNDEVACVWTGQGFTHRKFSQLKVGQCVLVKENELFPADMVVLVSSHSNGTCTVTTASIMGENDQSVKTAVKELQRILPTEDSPQSFHFARLNVHLKVDSPTSDFHSFQGKMTIKTLPRASVLTLSHLVLRGSMLHTQWVLGVVVYAGMETKIWLTRTHATRKLTLFSKGVNIYTALAGLILLLLVGLLTLIQHFTSLEPLQGADTLIYFLLLSGTIPVSLSLCINLVRVILLVRYRREVKGVVFKSGTFSEDLAGVRYVLMDKTGTVTGNNLQVTQIVVDDSIYSHSDTNSSLDSPSNQPDSHRVLTSPTFKPCLSFSYLQEKLRSGVDPIYTHLCECMLLCNTVDVTEVVDREEVAIVETVKELGCRVVVRESEGWETDMFDSAVNYRLLASKKSAEMDRMRVLVEREVGSEGVLYVKGPFQTVKDVMNLTGKQKKRLEGQLEEMVRSGLRPVVLGYQVFTGETLVTVKTRAQSAHYSHVNREGKTEILFKELEKGMQFLGIIGLIDTVTEKNKLCIETIERCGVQTWLVSGDTETNTLACAYSLGLLRENVKLVHLKKIQGEACGRKLREMAKVNVFSKHGLSLFQDETPQENAIVQNWSEANADSLEFSLSIDGVTLSCALQDRVNRRLLACLLYSASFVCFNRLLPSHKRELAGLLKRELGKRAVVMAVGDDCSNVAMMLEADIGVGISNPLDSRAANISDLAVPSLCSLGQVLLSARENYELLTKVTLLCIYSTIFLHFFQLIYMFLANSTPTALFPFNMTIYFTTLVCLLPIVTYGVLHRKRFIPETYANTGNFAFIRFKKYIFLTILHVLVVLGLVSVSFYAVLDVAMEEITVIVMIIVVITVNMQVSMEIKSIWFLPVNFISVGLAISYFFSDIDYKNAFENLSNRPVFVLSILMTPLACVPVSFLCLHAGLIRASNQVYPITSQGSLIRRLHRESEVISSLYDVSHITRTQDTTDSVHFHINPHTLKFTSKETEEEYMTHYVLNNIGLIRLGLGLTVLQLGVCIKRIAVDEQMDIPFVTLGLVGTVSILGATWLQVPIVPLIQAYITLFAGLLFTLDIITDTIRGVGYALIPIGLFTIVKENWVVSIAIVTGSALLLGIDVAVHLVYNEKNWTQCEETIGTFIVYLLICLLTIPTAYRSNHTSRTCFQLFKETEQRMEQNETILSFLLPEFVRRQVKDGFRYIAEDKDSVTILFCEICNFDTIISSYSPMDLTEQLDDIFHQIDDLCVSLGVAKIETVGKVYMACTGLSDFESDLPSELQATHHSLRALELAFAILNSFRGYRLMTGELIQFKIGIHTGPVIAGVVGYTKPQFSLVGDTVNTASRMSTTAPGPNTIQVSEACFYDLKAIALMCEFVSRVVNVKGKGEQVTYLAKEIAGVVKNRRRSTSEDSMTLLRGKNRHRSSVVASLRDSLELQEAFSRTEQQVIEHVQWAPWISTHSEELFRREILSRYVGSLRFGGKVYILAVGVRIAIEYRLESEYALIPGIVWVVCMGMSGFVVGMIGRRSDGWWVPWCLLTLYFLTSLGLSAESWLSDQPGLTTQELLFTFILLYYCSGLLFRHVLLGSICIVTLWVGVCIGNDYLMWEYAIFSAFFAVQHCIQKYFEEKNERLIYSVSELASSEIEKTERLLTHMLPGHAYESLKLEELVSDRLVSVTLLYADISGFTAWASIHTPQEVVTHLSTIYAAFDKTCTRLGLYKVHTIGDCYVAMSATTNSDSRVHSEECRRVITLAQEMIAELDEHGEVLRMRIGLHCGDVIACITGSKVVRYDIYGSDVLMANKVESSGCPGRINVSEDVKRIVESSWPGRFAFEFNQEVQIEDPPRSLRSFFLVAL